MMDFERRVQPCQCPHQDTSNILHSLLNPSCQSHSKPQTDNASMTKHHHNGQSVPSAIGKTPAFSTAVSLRTSPSYELTKSHVPADLSLRDHPAQLMTQQDRDIWLARQRHCHQSLQIPYNQQTGEFSRYQQQLQQQQRREQQQVRHQLRQQLQHQQLQHQHQQQQQQQQHQQQLQLYQQQLAMSSSSNQHIQNRPTPSPYHIGTNGSTILSRSSLPRSTSPVDHFPLEQQANTATVSPFHSEESGDHRLVLSRPRSSSISSHGSSQSIGRYSSGRSSLSSHDSTDNSLYNDGDSGYSSSSSASPCVTVAEADGYQISMSPKVPDSDAATERNSGSEVSANAVSLGPFDSNKLYRILRGEKLDSSASHDERSANISVEANKSLKRSFDHVAHHQQPEQDAPMDLTCKKIKLEVPSSPTPSPLTKFNSGNNNRQPNPRQQAWAFIDGRGSPMQNSIRAATPGSMLKTLLHGRIEDEQRDSDSGTDTPPLPFATGKTPVTIAKKNLFPVSARVSDWLLKSVQFAQERPEYCQLSHNDQVTLLLTSWPRLLLLQMAETNFQFAVTPVLGDPATESANSGDGDRSRNGRPCSRPTTATSITAETPTMSAVEKIQGFIKKCQSMALDAQEYALLKSATLFNTGYSGGINDVSYVEEVNSCVRQALQDHIRVTRHEMRRYSQLLMCLPTLFGINCKMVEKLFCKHITENMDVDVLLKEMLSKRIA